jgi:hypothetical protein
MSYEPSEFGVGEKRWTDAQLEWYRRLEFYNGLAAAVAAMHAGRTAAELSCWEGGLARWKGGNCHVAIEPPGCPTLPAAEGGGTATSVGWVYILRAETGVCKIGKTTNPKERARFFEIKLPFAVEVLHLIRCGNMHAAERMLHAYFAGKRVNGEWFNLTDDDLAFLTGIASIGIGVDPDHAAGGRTK